ncbi:MAG TPA: hypothetical protein PKK99_15025, partial [Bacteroidia bacterium]|nr:hypothetical protein [Bacteroidia bacterium]
MDLLNGCNGTHVYQCTANNLPNIQAPLNPQEILYFECYDRFEKKVFSQYGNEINHAPNISFLSVGLYDFRF